MLENVLQSLNTPRATHASKALNCSLSFTVTGMCSQESRPVQTHTVRNTEPKACCLAAAKASSRSRSGLLPLRKKKPTSAT
eukprot:3323766-Amphidinium_carterae.2